MLLDKGGPEISFSTISTSLRRAVLGGERPGVIMIAAPVRSMGLKWFECSVLNGDDHSQLPTVVLTSTRYRGHKCGAAARPDGSPSIDFLKAWP